MTLERELEIVGDYLALESLRFGERLAHRARHRTAARSACAFRSCCCRPSSRMRSSTASPSCPAEACCGSALRCASDGLHIEVENPRPASRSVPAIERGRRPAQCRRSGCGCCSARAPALELDLSRADRGALARIDSAVPAEALMKAMIVDDEPLARRELRRLLAEFPWVEIVGEAGNMAEAEPASSTGSRSCCFSTSRCRAAPASICSRASSTCRA